jgi:hypothetical protein
MKAPASRILVGLVLTAAVAACLLPGRGQAVATQNKRGVFMRQKLEYSKNILEGLTREDFAMIAQNARKMKALSKAAEWELPIPNADEYLTYTTDFQRIADALLKKAEAKSLDGTTLAFNRMTVNCVECHRFVRGNGK